LVSFRQFIISVHEMKGFPISFNQRFFVFLLAQFVMCKILFYLLIFSSCFNTFSIGSWLPNHLDPNANDFHTKYVCTVAYDYITKPGKVESWQIEFRYSQIKDLYGVFSKYYYEINDVSPLQETFPMASISHGLFGITDQIRNERMSKFDLWLREVTMNPMGMTIWEVVEAVYAFLEVDRHVAEH
jgi:hypothetical protein